MGIEPTSPAWKAGVIASIRHPQRSQNGGGGRIRTFEAEATDLQSVGFDRSPTPPKNKGGIITQQLISVK